MTKASKIILAILLVLVLAALVVYCVAFGKPTEESAVQTSEPTSDASDVFPGEDTAEGALSAAEELTRAAETAYTAQSAVTVTLTDGASSASVPSVQIEGDTVTLTASGVYELSGTLTDGQVLVDTDGTVTLILDGAEITSSADAAIRVENAEHVLVYFPDGSENSLISGTEQEITAADENSNLDSAEGAALYARDNLSFAGSGSLTVGGYLNNGVATTDRLTVLGGTLTIAAVNHGLKGKDSVLVADGTLNITSGNDAIKSNNDTDEDCGNVVIRGGTLNLTALGDGVQAERDLTVEGGTVNIVTGELSESTASQNIMSESNLPDGFGDLTGTDMFANIDGITENDDGTISVSEEAAEQILSMAAELFGETDVTAEQVEACTSYDELAALFQSDMNLTMPGNLPEAPDGNATMTIPEGDTETTGGDTAMATREGSMPGGDMAMPEGDMTVPGEDMTMPDGDMTMPQGGGTAPGGDFSEDGTERQMPDGGSMSGGMTKPNGEETDGDASQPQMPAENGGSEEEGQQTSRQGGMGGDMADLFDREWSGSSDSDTSTKGLKSGGNIAITGGTVTVTSGDDALHADGSITVTGGSLSLASGDDGIHADGTLTVDGGDVTVTQAYEGIEAHCIYLKSGNVSVTASDDGLNANGGTSMFGAMFSDSDSDDDSMPTLQITGGTLYVNAGGDGLDSNGDLIVEAGSVIVDGPSDNGNGALDSGTESGGVLICNGGTVLAIGGSGMAECFESDSAQPSFIYNFDSTVAAGSEITISDSEGNVIFTHTAAKAFNSVVFSSAELTEGTTVTLTAGDQTALVSIDGAVNGNSTGSSMGSFFGGFSK